MSIQDTGIKKNECANCHKPIILAWCGKQGMYCSNVCYEAAELSPPLADGTKSKENTVAEEKTTAPAAATKAEPTTDKKKKKGASSSKATAPKKQAPAKKSAGKSEGSKRGSHWPREYIIRKTDTFKDHKYKGLSAERLAVIKTGMTLDAYFAALKEAGLPCGTGNLQAAEKAGYITVEKK